MKLALVRSSSSSSSGDEEREVSIGGDGASIDGRTVALARRPDAASPGSVEIGGEAVSVRVAVDGDRAFVWCAGRTYEFRRSGGSSSGARRSGRHEGQTGLAAPMPGRVRKVLVAEGDRVARGDVLLILEAMKMEHAIRAPSEGRVVRLCCGEGELVEAGVELVELE